MTNHTDPDSAPVEARARISARLDELEFHRAVDVEYRLDGALKAESEAARIGATDLEFRARLVRADMLQRKGLGAEAAALAADVNRWARENGPQSLLARSHLVLAAVFENVGDSGSCLENALRGVELLEDTTPPRTRGNFLARLADAFTITGSFDSARPRYRQALAIFDEIGDVERRLSVLNNLAYSETVAGDLESARVVAAEMRALLASSGTRSNPAFEDTLARLHIGLGELDQAEAAIVTAMELLAQDGDVQAVTPAELKLTLAEIHRKQGRLDDARRDLDSGREIARRRGLTGIEAEILREQAELLAASGQFEQAYETYRIYHEQSSRLFSGQHEAAARTREALFATAEARREAQRYWRQARTDELTRLPNRRFVDEELARRIREAAAGIPLVVAIAGADHFKRINDTVSHDAGDRVIQGLAGVLESALGAIGRVGRIEDAASRIGGEGEVDASSPFVARLGGEEFLLVLPDVAVDEAADFLEGVRKNVEEHTWKDAESAPVTISIGGTVARPQDTQSDLLARADRCLYAAKRSGRNRVVVDFGPNAEQPDAPVI